jgi:hypothetical protein
VSAVIALGPGVGTPPAPVRTPSSSTPAPATQKAVVTLKKLDYPFKVLELVEDVESGPVPADPSPRA